MWLSNTCDGGRISSSLSLLSKMTMIKFSERYLIGQAQVFWPVFWVQQEYLYKVFKKLHVP